MKYRVTREIVYEVAADDVDKENYGATSMGDAIDMAREQRDHPAVVEQGSLWRVEEIR